MGYNSMLMELGIISGGADEMTRSQGAPGGLKVRESQHSEAAMHTCHSFQTQLVQRMETLTPLVSDTCRPVSVRASDTFPQEKNHLPLL